VTPVSEIFFENGSQDGIAVGGSSGSTGDG
jgi:hypothetical protein